MSKRKKKNFLSYRVRYVIDNVLSGVNRIEVGEVGSTFLLSSSTMKSISFEFGGNWPLSSLEKSTFSDIARATLSTRKYSINESQIDLIFEVKGKA